MFLKNLPEFALYQVPYLVTSSFGLSLESKNKDRLGIRGANKSPTIFKCDTRSVNIYNIVIAFLKIAGQSFYSLELDILYEKFS